MYVVAFGAGPAFESQLASDQAGTMAGSVATLTCAASTQGKTWPTVRFPGLAFTASSVVQPDSQGASSSLAGTAGSLPQSWAGNAGWAGTAARHRHIPDPTRSHASIKAHIDLVRTGLSLPPSRLDVKSHSRPAGLEPISFPVSPRGMPDA